MKITIKPKSEKDQARIKAILKATDIDFLEDVQDENLWNKISDEEKKSIELGLNDAEDGKFKPHSEVKKLYEKWL